ncbi:membrane protein [Mycobacterium phage Paola]|uniref:Uncharacterized protein n=2 Tax=Kratiovirus TaxID=2948788 RepID=A0A2R4APZ6_9CAUD|nr:hypothetical protein I5G73_gp59 [Mycobacterium phage Leston]YP_009950846.1 membrane protein [Mycobacterium phage Paola]ASR85828.1 hypothetical protein SEA_GUILLSMINGER_41 [Mycobacterium phage Guillsminger]AVO25830.1 membrane protein [Mycobacterium phage Paola]AVR77106.1 hypothetical protein SEA_LESTON_40 [Mycobacterium phage Leston]
MTLDLIAAIATRIAVPLLIAAAWYRRRSWSNRWEQPITLHLILLAIGLGAATHLVSIEGPLTDYIYGHCLDTYIGDVATLFGFAVLASTMLTRISTDDDDAQQLVNKLVAPFVTLAPALMLAATIVSAPSPAGRPAALFPATDGWLEVTDAWQAAYWCIFYVSGGTLAAITAWAARIITTDPRSRFGARLWLFAMRCAALACLMGVVNTVTDLNVSWLVWMLSALVSITAAAAGYLSWRRRMQPFRRLLEFTRTTRCERRTFNTSTPHRNREGDEPAPAL